MKIQEINIDEVIPYSRNPRNNKAAISKVASSIKEFGWKQPIVVDKDNIVIVGHTRLEAARSLKLKTVPVLHAKDLSDAQVKAYRIADNKVGEFAEWDYELLECEFDDLKEVDFDLELTGFSDEEIQEAHIEGGEEVGGQNGMEGSHRWKLGKIKVDCDELLNPELEVIINAWEKHTGKEAVHIASNRTYNEIKSK